MQGVPTNKLHACGFISIGCEPCTRAVLPNQHEREGRWWWEDATAKECGLHSGNIVQGAVDQAREEAVRDLFQSNNVESLSKEQLETLLDGPRDKDTLVVLYAPWCRFCQAMEDSYEEVAAQMAGNKKVRIAKFQADIERDFASTKFGLKTYPHIAFLPSSGVPGTAIKYPSERRDTETLSMWLKTISGYETS